MTRRSLRLLAPLLLGAAACDGSKSANPSGVAIQADVQGDAAAPAAPPAGFSGRSQSRIEENLVAPIPGDATAAALHVREAASQYRLGHWDQAIAESEKAVTADPANLRALVQQGYLRLLPTGPRDPSKAWQAFRLALLVDGKSIDARLGAALALTELQDDARAREELALIQREAAAGAVTLRDDQHAAIEKALATISLRAGDFAEAERWVEQAIQRQPKDRALFALRAEVRERMGRFADADADLVQAIEQRPEESKLHFVRARVLRRMGRESDADKEMRIHHVLAPFEEDVSKGFQKDFARRIELRRELVAAYPEFRRARHLLVRELVDGGELDQARQELDLLLTEDANDREALFLLARALAKRGDKDGARAAADRMLATGKTTREVYDDLLREIGAVPGPDPGADNGGR